MNNIACPAASPESQLGTQSRKDRTWAEYTANRPLVIDLFCGMFGWGEGFIAEGWRVVGFDLEDMRGQFGLNRLPHTQLVIQDVCTLHGSQFKDATLIVASPPCQEYSYMAMPWKLGKAKAKAIRDDTTGEKLAALNRLFNQCFRIQREASLAAGRHIPLIVENVKGAQPWVGRARWAWGSFYLWGDVPALMPMTSRLAQKLNPDGTNHGTGSWFAIADSKNRGSSGVKAPGMNWSDRTKRGQDFTLLAGQEAIKNAGGSWFNVAHNTTTGKGQNPDGRIAREGRKGAGAAWFDANLCQLPSKSPRRKMASALIAKIPLPLSRHIGAIFRSPLIP